MKCHCLRCGNGWDSLWEILPKTCPNCKSLKWQSLKPYNDPGAKRKKVPGDPQGIFSARRK